MFIQPDANFRITCSEIVPFIIILFMIALIDIIYKPGIIVVYVQYRCE
jgi:hypothetical protein